MKIPQFENPINTVNDLIDRNITIFEYDYMFEPTKDGFLQQNSSEWDHVASTMNVGINCVNDNCAEINGTYQYLIKHHVFGNMTHAFIKGYLYSSVQAVMPEKRNWWRSEKVLTTTNPYGGLQTSRNWILNEVKFFPLNFT